MQKKISLKKAGFTLIELMIVVAIIGILTSIAYPSYQESVAKSRRSDAKGALLVFANAMERHFTVNNTYQNAAGTDGTPTNTGAPRPGVFGSQHSPLDGGTALYDLTISAANATTYTLLATRTGAQSSDGCGNLTYTNTGVKGVTSNSGGHTATSCW
jgi:type IV pilus assembly protein PilE